MKLRTLARLDARLLRLVLLPLAFTWALGNLLSAAIAYHFTQRAFDRTLLEDAYVLATGVQLRNGQLVLDLSTAEINRVVFDAVETMHYSVVQADGTLLAGRQRLPIAPPEADTSHRFQDVELGGRTLRGVALHRELPVPFDVMVAETTASRDAALRQQVGLSLLPETMLLIALAMWLRWTIRNELRPLADLQDALGRRSANDLAPVPVEATSREVATLAGALNDLLARLALSVRAQREFAGNVAHELRTPLAGIRALVDYGLARNEPAIWRGQLERIAASETRASRLVDQLLELALALEARSGLKLEPVALDRLVRDSVLRFLPRADAAGVDLGAVGIDGPCEIRTDATLIEGILNNLLDNALRYGHAVGGVPSAVTVALECGTDAVVLSVLDNGPGLPGELQAQLVRRGAQGELGQLLGQGSGLGLALVSQYATLLGGTMTLSSGPGGVGWLCAIRLPR
ncbi:MAG TPA: sensor histidine kinase N-terminal domain-containing protein [Ramlibacter sp.]|nr:sensor histidine kinase N-terminal domain-containing protein [Ramlibacter sp.]